MKKEIRQAVLAQMKSLNGVEKQQADAWLTQQFLQSKAYQEAGVLATYLPFSHEFSTGQLIKQALADGKRLVVPKTYAQGQMIFVDYNPQQVEKTRFGLLEPISHQAVDKAVIDLIHVPGVAFNAKGYRIGYGGGYYDRYLADFSRQTISTIYKCQLADFAPDEHDIAVKEILLYESN